MPETPPNLVNENKLPDGNPGSIQRFFQICCSVCKGIEIGSATHIDKFIDDVTNRKKEPWRFSSDQRWTHRRCCRVMPTNIKLTVLASKPNIP